MAVRETSLRRLLTALARRPWALVLPAAALVFAVWAIGTRQQSHHVRVAFAEALDLVPGMDVRVRGQNVGRVTKVDLSGGKPVVELGIKDEAWPLHAGTRALLRWGSTLGLGERRVDLVPGPRSAPAIGEGGVIPAQDAVVPTEFDDVFQTLDAPARRDMQRLFAETDAALSGHEQALGEGVATGARAFKAAGGVLGDLAADADALDALVRQGDRMTHTLATHSGRIRSLMSVAALTFDTLARHAGDVQRSIEAMPATLRAARPALARLDTSLGRFTRLMEAVAPGARVLPAALRDLRLGVAELRATAPTGVAAVRALRRAAPSVEELLRRGTPLVKELEPALAQGLPIVTCLRPYAPELAGVISNWASYNANYDANGHYARVSVALGLPNLAVYPKQIKTAQFTQLTGIRYASLLPPGWLGGRRDFAPDCGVDAGVFDPANDWDDR